MERTLVLVKPDGVQRALVGEIISRLERRGLKIVAMKMIKMDRGLAERHYAAHSQKPFFKGLVSFITSGPVVAMVLEGKSAVQVVRSAMGATAPLDSAQGTIRGDLALDIGANLTHGSDSDETARKEIGLFFSEGEVLEYARDVDRWIIES